MPMKTEQSGSFMNMSLYSPASGPSSTVLHLAQSPSIKTGVDKIVLLPVSLEFDTGGPSVEAVVVVAESE